MDGENSHFERTRQQLLIEHSFMEKIGKNIFLHEPIKISMVGSRGVGKTSLLASMYNQMVAKGDSVWPSTLDEGRTQKKMSTCISSLKRLASGKTIAVEMSGDGTSEKTEYVFETTTLVKTLFSTAQLILPFSFLDFPGGWFTEIGDKRKIVDEDLTNSRISFLAVDAPAVMGEDFIHDQFNAPLDVHALYARNAGLLSQKRHTVILVLMRAEKYVSEKSINILIRKTKERYADLSELLNKKNIPFVGTYVETIGGIQFRHFRDEGDTVIPQFMNTGEGFSPKRCDLPLRLGIYLGIASIIEQIEEDMGKSGFWSKTLETIFRKKGGILEAYREILGKIQRNNPEDFFHLIKK